MSALKGIGNCGGGATGWKAYNLTGRMIKVIDLNELSARLILMNTFVLDDEQFMSPVCDLLTA
jgi:hypothetical protein